MRFGDGSGRLPCRSAVRRSVPALPDINLLKSHSASAHVSAIAPKATTRRASSCQAVLQENLATTRWVPLTGYSLRPAQLWGVLVGLAALVAELGGLRALVHTAGVSPKMAAGRRVLEVELLS